MEHADSLVLDEKISTLREMVSKLFNLLEEQRKEKHRQNGEIGNRLNLLKEDISVQAQHLAVVDERMRAIKADYDDVKTMIENNNVSINKIFSSLEKIDATVVSKIDNVKTVLRTLCVTGAFFVGLFTILGIIFEMRHNL